MLTILDIMLTMLYIMSMSTRLRNDVLSQRAVNRLTQSELAEQAGVTRQTIAAIEKESYAPSALLAFQLAFVLHTPINELFWLEDKEET